MLKSIEFSNYKRFKSYRIKLESGNVLVGPNNAGKSSLLDALRILEICLKFARRRNPTSIEGADGNIYPGHKVIEGFSGVNLAHSVYNYGEEDAIIKIELSKGTRALIHIHPDRPVKFYIMEPLQKNLTVKRFNSFFDFDIIVVPTISALESDEQHVSLETLQKNLTTRLASRNFRTFWFHSSDDDFQAFRLHLEKMWTGITIKRPERNFSGSKTTLTMFYEEDRMSREIAWSGFGFQAWMQIYTHMLRQTRAKSVLVLDEPDVYLHPDLQIKLLHDLRSRFSQFVIATHSIEIVNEAHSFEIASINNIYKSAKRVSSEDDYSSLFSYLGSNSNYELAAIAKAKKVIFVEGQDGKILRRLARRIGLHNLSANTEVPIIPLGGFSEWKKAINAIWSFKEIAKLEITTLAIFDRDYRSDEEIAELIKTCSLGGLEVNVLTRKEIENNFLVNDAITKAVNSRGKKQISKLESETLLLEACETYKYRVEAQLEFEESEFLKKRGGLHLSTITEACKRKFDNSWKDFAYKIKKVPGKDTFSTLNLLLAENGYPSITYAAVSNGLVRSDFDDEFVTMLIRLDEFVAP